MGMRVDRVAAWAKRLGPLVGLIVFAAALALLHRLLQRFHLSDVTAALARIPHRSVLSALALTVASYLALGGFDGLAVRYIGRSLPPWRTVLVSFVSHAVSHSAGFATLTGGAVRFRLYSAAGLTTAEVAAVVAFCGLTFGLGASSLAAVALLAEPTRLSAALRLPAPLLAGLGGGLALAVAGYVAWGGLARRPIRIGRRQFPVPRPRLAALQILVAASDLALAAGALLVLLPEAARPSYPAFIGAYVVANLLGLAAHVPGGLGVFDAAILVLTPTAPADTALGALVLFRAVYHLLPLAVAALILLLYEVLGRVPRLRPLVEGAFDEIGPPLLAMLVFAVGGLTVLAKAVPQASQGRLFVLVEAGLGSLLMGLARGLNRRNRLARLAAGGGLALLAVLVLAQDPFAPRAVVLGLLAVVLALAKDMSGPGLGPPPPLSAAWALAIGAVLAAAGWITGFEARSQGIAAAVWQPSLQADMVAVAVYGAALAAGRHLGGGWKR